MLLDHVVIKVDDLEQTIEAYSKFGFTVIRGGEHKKQGSHNALIAFSDGSYLELIAFREPSPLQNRPEKMLALLQAGASRRESRGTSRRVVSEGLLDFAVMPTTLEEDFEQLKHRQLDIEGPTSMERHRPDGQEVRWEMGIPDQLDLPFLIRDITPRNLRIPEEQTHSLGVSGISKLVMVIHDLEKSAVRYEKLLNTPPLEHIDEDLPDGHCLAFPCGSTKIVLLEADGTNPVLKKHLETRGESVWSLELALDHSLEIDPLKLEKLQEVRIYFQHSQ